MDESKKTPKMPLTFRQAVANKWQVPLFALSLIGFTLTMVFLRPQQEPPDYQGMIDQLHLAADQNRPEAFYARAEAVRQVMLRADQYDYLADVHRLAAEFRCDDLTRRGMLGVRPDVQKAEKRFYQAIIDDYLAAFHGNRPDPNTPEAGKAYDNMALAYWAMGQSDWAMKAVDRAVRVDRYSPARGQMKVNMLLAAQPEDYAPRVFDELDRLETLDANDCQGRAWAFMKRIELMIDLGREREALDLVTEEGGAFEQTCYADMLTLLRCRALRFSGQLDQADIGLRALLAGIHDYGDLYAMALLELADINYQQARDTQARRFYRMVESSQMNTDWSIAALLGLARCEALARRFERSGRYFEQTIERLKKRGRNPVIAMKDVRKNLAALADELILKRHYAQALDFALLENKIAPNDDLASAQRLARLYGYRAGEILEQLAQAESQVTTRQGDLDGRDDQDADEIRQWKKQQQRLASECYANAARAYAKVALLVQNDDKLYGDCLYQAARGFDLAGDADESIKAWGRFVSERKKDPRWPGALFYMAQACQAVGDFDNAILYYRQLRTSDPRLPVSFDAAVLLAQCYLWEDPDDTDQRAENLLLSVLHDPAITPAAVHFRKATFELGKLYYTTGRYRQAIGVLITAIDRYQDVEGIGQGRVFCGRFLSPKRRRAGRNVLMN